MKNFRVIERFRAKRCRRQISPISLFFWNQTLLLYLYIWSFLVEKGKQTTIFCTPPLHSPFASHSGISESFFYKSFRQGTSRFFLECIPSQYPNPSVLSASPLSPVCGGFLVRRCEYLWRNVQISC